MRGRPLSPRDTVPIVANGNPIDRDSLPPIGVRQIRATSPTIALSPLTSPSPLPFTRAPTPIVAATPETSRESPAPEPAVDPPTLDRLLTPQENSVDRGLTPQRGNSVVITPPPRGPIRILSTPGRRTIYRVRKGQARSRILPLPASINRDGRIDYSSLSLDDQYRYQALILSKYNSLRDANRWLDIPPLDHSLTLDQKHDQYIIYHREVSIRLAVERYKRYLSLGLRLFELFGTKFLKLRVLEGYSQAQESNFTLYEDFLREMAEKNYEVTNSRWPVEVRLIVTALIQAAIFSVLSYLGSFLGTSHLGPLVNGITNMFTRSGPASSSADNGIPEPPRQEGFDLGSILNIAQSFLGGTSQRAPAPRRPAFSE